LPLGKLHIWNVATWEIVTWEVALGKMPLGKNLTPYFHLVLTLGGRLPNKNCVDFIFKHFFPRPEDPWESSKSGDERLGWSTRPGSAPTRSRPPWIERDRQILTFFCYTIEQVYSSQEEQDR